MFGSQYLPLILQLTLLKSFLSGLQLYLPGPGTSVARSSSTILRFSSWVKLYPLFFLSATSNTPIFWYELGGGQGFLFSRVSLLPYPNEVDLFPNADTLLSQQGVLGFRDYEMNRLALGKEQSCLKRELLRGELAVSTQVEDFLCFICQRLIVIQILHQQIHDQIYQILCLSHSAQCQLTPTISSSYTTECHIFSAYTTFLSGEGDCSSKSRGEKGSAFFSTPEAIHRNGALNCLQSLLTSAIPFITARTAPGMRLSVKIKGSALSCAVMLYLVFNPGGVSCFIFSLGSSQPKQIMACFEQQRCSSISFSAGARKSTPAYFQGNLRVALKATVPPQLIPLKNIFGFCLSLSVIKLTKVQSWFIESSIDIINPLRSPLDLPKFI